MAFPSQTFNTLAEWVAWVNANIIPNGMELITGDDGNITENAAAKFISQSPLNWEEAEVFNTSGAVVITRPVSVFTGNTPSGITWTENIYNEFVFINMTAQPVPITSPAGYYNLTGQLIDEIPANTAISVFLASNDLWVQGTNLGTSSGIAQKEPRMYIVGTTTGAPTSGTTTWTLPAFMNSWVGELLINKVPVDLEDAGDGSPYISKPLASDTLTISNYGTGWYAGDKLQFILITP